MAGPSAHVDYIADDGNIYRTLVPQWVATLTGSAAATSAIAVPKGLRKRHRYFRLATGEEGRFVVPAAASPMWSDAFGTTITPAAIGKFAGFTAVLQGRTGERTKRL